MYLEQNNKNKWLMVALLGLVTGGILLLVAFLNQSQTYRTPAAGLAGTRSVVCRWDATKIPDLYGVTIQLLDNQRRVVRAIPNPEGNSYTFQDVAEGSFPTICHLDLVPNQAGLEACVYETPVTCDSIPTITPSIPLEPSLTPTTTPGGPTNTPTPTATPGGPTNTPTPTNTPGGPTSTPTPKVPTATPKVPTNPPAPTNTPVPLPPTSTPRPGGPTSTPAPTNTPVLLPPTKPPVNPPAKLVNPPAPTNTPVPLPPTSTPRPGGPTSTPAPTNTPVPAAPTNFPELPKAGINVPTMLIVAMGVVILLLAFAL